MNPTGNGKLETEAIEPFETRSFHTVLSGSGSILLFCFIYFFNLGQSRIDSHKHNGGRTRPSFPPPHVSECNLNRECLDVGSSLESHSPQREWGSEFTFYISFLSSSNYLQRKQEG